MESLEDYAWLNSPEGFEAWRTVVKNQFSSRFEIRSDLGISEHLADLLTEQIRFAQGKARSKVEHPDRWFWNQRLFEQASDEWTACETALDAPEYLDTWFDICCGAGVDSVALAHRRTQVTAVDCHPIAIALTRANASMNQVQVQTRECLAESLTFGRNAYLSIDPDRRNDRQRTIDPNRSQPNWEWIAGAIPRCGAASLKLAPGLRVTEEFDWYGVAKPQVVRWLSWDGSVRQQRWCWGIERWPEGSCVVSCGTRKNEWHHEIFESEFIRAHGEPISQLDEPSQVRSGYIADQDPVLRAAGVSALLADRIEAACIGDRNGYFHHTRPISHPMLRWFRVIDILAMDSKRIRAMARNFGASVWELKSRGVDIDLDAMRRRLPTDPNSDRRLTLLFTRLGKKHVAIVAQRVEVEKV
jgi:hypothetical protein